MFIHKNDIGAYGTCGCAYNVCYVIILKQIRYEHMNVNANILQNIFGNIITH